MSLKKKKACKIKFKKKLAELTFLLLYKLFLVTMKGEKNKQKNPEQKSPPKTQNLTNWIGKIKQKS